MDPRSAVRTIVVHDVVLGPLLDTEPRGRRHDRHSLRSVSAGPFIHLEWTAHKVACATARRCLTVQAHLPRHELGDHSQLNFLLQRARALLTTGTVIVGNGFMIDVGYGGTSHVFAASDGRTICQFYTFHIDVCRVRKCAAQMRLVQ